LCLGGALRSVSHVSAVGNAFISWRIFANSLNYVYIQSNRVCLLCLFKRYELWKSSEPRKFKTTVCLRFFNINVRCSSENIKL